MGTFLTVLFLAATVAALSVFVQTFKMLRDSKAGENTENQYEQNHRRLWVMVFTGYVFILLSAYLIFALTAPLPEPGKEETVWNPMSAIFFLALFHFVASFRIVRVTELGAILFFGRALYQISSGLRFTPWLICELKKDPRTVFEDELPADPEKIYRGERDKPEVVPENLLKEGFRPPIRMTFLAVTKEKKIEEAVKDEAVDDPLEERVTAETPIVVRWKIVDYIKFLTTIGGYEEARRQMQDIGVTVLADIFPKLTVADAIKTKGDADAKLQTKLSETTASWGITIENAAVKHILLSHELNLELQKIAEAKAKKRSDKLIGEGQGAKEQGILSGRAAGFKGMATTLNVSAEAVLASETARAITSNPGQRTVIAGVAGFQELAGAVVGIAETFKESKQEPEKGGAP